MFTVLMGFAALGIDVGRFYSERRYVQDAVDSADCHRSTCGLLPDACRAHSASRMLRGMATLGGESVEAAPDSELTAALLALNAVFVVARPDGTLEIPALRFLKHPAKDLEGGGLLVSIVVPGAPQGAALERIAVLPSAPSLVAVAMSALTACRACASG